MSVKRIVWIGGFCLVLAVTGVVLTSARNVAPDAVTKATHSLSLIHI